MTLCKVKFMNNNIFNLYILGKPNIFCQRSTLTSILSISTPKVGKSALMSLKIEVPTLVCNSETAQTHSFVSKV